jgi:hypothetical protein
MSYTSTRRPRLCLGCSGKPAPTVNISFGQSNSAWFFWHVFMSFILPILTLRYMVLYGSKHLNFA